MELNDAISRLGDYSFESNFALNEAKTKWILVSTRQKSRALALHDYYPVMSCNEKLLERVTTDKILSMGVHMDEHVTWADHILRFFHPLCSIGGSPETAQPRTIPHHVRKQLVESLGISKLD